MQVLINEVDEKTQSRDRERARKEEEDRLLDQLRHSEGLDALKRVQVIDNTPGDHIFQTQFCREPRPYALLQKPTYRQILRSF